MSIKEFVEWPEWESIMHGVVLFLFIYIIYRFVVERQPISNYELILLLIASSLEVIVHQNINNRNEMKPKYSL